MSIIQPAAVCFFLESWSRLFSRPFFSRTKVNDYWEECRGLYAPFESGQKSGSADVYNHEMPGNPPPPARQHYYEVQYVVGDVRVLGLNIVPSSFERENIFFLKKFFFGVRVSLVLLHCRLAGGQYTNLLFQSHQLGLSGRWPQIKRAYASANHLLGDIIKVLPVSRLKQAVCPHARRYTLAATRSLTFVKVRQSAQ